jgi:DNA polymerase-3 subunit delta'
MFMQDHHFPTLLGNMSLRRRLSKDIEEKRLSHAYILEGPRGSGKHTVALLSAAALSCTEQTQLPCGHCKSCEKILSGNSPDIITVGLEGEKVTIGVESIRLLKNDMYTAPNELGVKVYIIEDADKMTVQAQNAFLLSLEEPPEYVLFFLLCESSADLLETVRSRAPTLRTERLDRSMVEAHLLENEKRARTLRDESPDEWREILAISSGCIGYALELLDSKKRKSVLEGRKNAERLISLLRSSDMAAAFETISALGTKRAEVLTSLSSLQQALRDLIVLKKCDSAPLCFFADPEKAAEQATYFTAPALFSLYDACVSAIDELERNANVRLCLMNMMQSAGLI